MIAVENLTARLEGSIVVLEPLAEEHVEELWAAAQAPEIWAWLAHLERARDASSRWLELTRKRQAQARREPSPPVT